MPPRRPPKRKIPGTIMTSALTPALFLTSTSEFSEGGGGDDEYIRFEFWQLLRSF